MNLNYIFLVYIDYTALIDHIFVRVVLWRAIFITPRVDTAYMGNIYIYIYYLFVFTFCFIFYYHYQLARGAKF